MKIKLYFYQEQYNWENTPRIGVFTYKISGPNEIESMSRIFIMESEVEIEGLDFLPESVVRNEMVSDLRARKNKIQAETHKKLSEIDDKIQQLLCIEMKPEQV